MNSVLRLVVTAVVAVATFYFVFWFSAALIPAGTAISVIGGLACAVISAVAAARFIWRRSADSDGGLIWHAVRGALIVGGIGFVGGFFGPMILTPGANQGPLLGLFITGPLGFLLGGAGGLLYGLTARVRRVTD